MDPLQPGQWFGPVQSGFGLHVVRVDERTPQVAPTLAAVRPIVAREWQADQKQQANAAFLAELRAKYEIRIEGQDGAAAGAGAAR